MIIKSKGGLEIPTGIYVNFPQEIIDSIEIMTEPKTERITFPGMTIKESRFRGLLSWVYCDECWCKKEVEEKKRVVLEEALPGINGSHP